MVDGGSGAISGATAVGGIGAAAVPLAAPPAPDLPADEGDGEDVAGLVVGVGGVAEGTAEVIAGGTVEVVAGFTAVGEAEAAGGVAAVVVALGVGEAAPEPPEPVVIGRP